MNRKLLELFEIPGIIVKIPTIWLLKQSMINNKIMYNAHLMVRYKTIESYINHNNNNWWNIYNKMQRLRVSQKKIIPRNKADNELCFKNLIHSIKDNGFDDNYPIIINHHFRLVDGSHRLAIALYLKIPYVPVTMTKDTIDIDPEYSLNWFQENGFDGIIDEIKNTYKKIMKEDKNE